MRATLVAIAVLAALVACERREAEAPPEPEPQLVLTPVAFEDLPGWGEDDLGGVLAAFLRSCDRLDPQPDERAMGGSPFAGTVADWRLPCTAARDLAPVADTELTRAFLRDWFQPYAAADHERREGLFTGYYEPLLLGAREPDERFSVPLYQRPEDLVSVDLGEFDAELAGRRLVGRLDGGRLRPFPSRAEIDEGALAGRDLELVWVDDVIDAFFLHIQGSGQVALPNGGRMRVGYADQNGHPYRAIGRDLMELGELERDEVSLQSIRAWLEANPERAFELMHRNPSYIFFRELAELAEEDGPLGAQGAPLTPLRSLAVDRRFVPYGAPVWLDTTAPYPDGEAPFRRLMIAQDTGGAIRGPVRGDVFWGAGEDAEWIAGHMRHPGRYYLLLPKSLAPTA